MPGRSNAADRRARRLYRFAVVAFAFGGGAYVAWAGVFPWDMIYRGVKTGATMVQVWMHNRSYKRDVAELLASSVEAKRVRLTDDKKGGGGELRDPVVLLDHPASFVAQCPQLGCLAVEYGGRGDVGRRWPLRATLMARLDAEAQPLEKAPNIAIADVLQTGWATPYSNGDLLITFTARWHDPQYLGVGRVGQDGQLLWFTPEGYSHHEGYVSAGDTAWVPGQTIEEPFRRLPEQLGTWKCDESHLQLDRVNVLDGSGTMVDSVSVLDAFLASRWAPVLIYADPCDPFHLNSVSMVGDDVSGLPDVRPGDLVLSLRNLDAFAVVDRETRVVKRYERGTFVRQHSVKHLGGSEFVLFDNLGGYAQDESGEYHRYSRVLVVDLASGEESVLFPRTPARRWLFRLRGRISLSPDRTRVLASFTRTGTAVEVRIADGTVLAEFDFRPLRGYPDPFFGNAFYSHEAR